MNNFTSLPFTRVFMLQLMEGGVSGRASARAAFRARVASATVPASVTARNPLGVGPTVPEVVPRPESATPTIALVMDVFGLH